MQQSEATGKPVEYECGAFGCRAGNASVGAFPSCGDFSVGGPIADSELFGVVLGEVIAEEVPGIARLPDAPRGLGPRAERGLSAGVGPRP